MELEQLLKELILELEIRDYSKRTLKSYRNNNLLMFTFIKKEFNITKIEDIKPTYIKSYIQLLQRKKRKPSYVNGLIKCFRAYFKYAIQEEIIDINPTIKVGWVREEKVLINTFTDKEVSRMMNTFKGSDYLTIRNKTIMAILFDTGIRKFELCNIKNCDVKDTIINIIQGKGKKDRRVTLSPYTRKLLLRYIRCRDSYFQNRILDNDTPYFLSYRFKILTVEAVERVVRLCGNEAKVRKKIRCSPHTCRHYYAQAQLRNGLDYRPFPSV